MYRRGGRGSEGRGRFHLLRHVINAFRGIWGTPGVSNVVGLQNAQSNCGGSKESERGVKTKMGY